jgi:hypothetical protein
MDGREMVILKKLGLFTVVTVAAVYMIVWFLETLGFRSPLFAFLINWFAMCWVGVVGPPVHLLFPASYYDIKAFERTGRVYERLGIRLFKRLVDRGPLRVFSPTLRLPEGGSGPALRRLEHEMRKSEAAHAFLFALMLPLVGYAALRGWLDAAGWILAFNGAINAYPLMLQRYNRNRLAKLLQRR